MSSAGPDFEPWLSEKLRALHTDEGVFGSYIAGILDGEDSLDEKRDALEGILGEFVERDIGTHVSEILDMWSLCRSRGASGTAGVDVDKQGASGTAGVDVEKQSLTCPEVQEIRQLFLGNLRSAYELSRLLECAAPAASAPRLYTAEEKKIRDAILSQYSQLSDHEEVATEAASGAAEGAELERNTNAEAVAAAARERREQARLNSQRKKDKDKEDREKQKQQKEEKKEKRKTQKGERKR